MDGWCIRDAECGGVLSDYIKISLKVISQNGSFWTMRYERYQKDAFIIPIAVHKKSILINIYNSLFH